MTIVEARNARRRARYAEDVEHRARIREAQRRRLAEDPEARERARERARRQRETKTEAYRESQRRYAREKGTARKRERRRSDPEVARRHLDAQAARRARKAGAFVERVFRSVVWKRDGGICGICHEPADPMNWHLDHVVPLVRGGEHSYANTQVAHPSCNCSKGGQ